MHEVGSDGAAGAIPSGEIYAINADRPACSAAWRA
ncbi:hypothetical protein CT19431_MP70040 [Cupriavidus taiwanensis]|nr:hypothetical protein CT19431_MP70040 [Cupriavidus taiwanensis]